MTAEAVQLANVMTTIVSKQNPIKEIRLYGKVQADERLLQSQVSYLPGRIEKLYVNFTGEVVSRGQTLAVIYSPDLITTQQELLETASTKQSQPILYDKR
jgi:Cu(I)/Ag(I) efflux system membrane fusion protein